ncbi:MAG: ATP-dependent Clp protease ATP-binding subunit [Candidatus Pacebacteria bacterium]|nr:ATP-dependent Clp protease ATP-binding subunit [Candidatus Paceibacterota bacterium]
MEFNLKNTLVFQAVKSSRNFIFQAAKPLMILCFILAAICAGLIFSAAWQDESIGHAWDKTLGFGVLFLACGIVFGLINSFFNTCLKRTRPVYTLADFLARPDEFNAAGFLNFNGAKVLSRAFDVAGKSGLTEPTCAMLLFCLLSADDPEINFVFQRGGVDFSVLLRLLKSELSGIKEAVVKPAGDFQKVLLPATKAARERGAILISPGDLLTALAEVDESFQKFLTENDFTKQDVANLAGWLSRVLEAMDFKKRFWEEENLLRKGSVGREFASGYTIMLDRYARDIRKAIKKGGQQEVIGHRKEIEQTERILERQELNNVLLVGEPNVGRRSVVRAVAWKAFFGKSVGAVNYKRFLEFDLTALVAGLGNQEQVEQALEACFAEVAKAGNIILVVNDFENFVQEQAKPGAINITGILTRYLSFSSFQMVAVASYEGLHRIIEKNPALLNLYDKVEVAEISPQETLVFLENIVPFFENKHKRVIGYKALREIIKLSGRYLGQLPFPDKAVRLLDEAMVFLSSYTKDKVLLPSHVQKIVSEKTQIPVGEAEKGEKQKLLNLEELMHQRLINQEEAVREVASALRRARAEVNVKAGPIGSFLFLGPTGVGKTETAKALAAIYFGSESRIVRLDMSEFQNVEDVKRFIGSETEPGLLTTPVKDSPFSLVLLDELEKAHPNILNLFLQVLDEGWITDGLGRKVNFKNTIIIATSNAGAEMIRQMVQEGKSELELKKDLQDFVLKEGIFRPEFVNRFDGVVVFRPLSRQNLLDIAQLQLAKLSRSLADKGIKMEITRELKEKIVELSYSPQFGAREMKRVIQDNLEDALAKAMLSGELKRGGKVSVSPVDFRLVIS